MTHITTFQEAKTYTQRLLSIKGFQNHKERVFHQQKLNQIKVKLIKLSQNSENQTTTNQLYAVKDFKKMVEKMEAAQLMRHINAQLLRLSV